MADLRMYPEGRGSNAVRYIKDVEVAFGVIKSLRVRVPLASVNAGLALLPALPGVRWRIFDWAMISIGGAAAGATTVDLLGVVSAASVKIGAVAVAALTQSALVRAGAANATILADGASFTQMDANAAVSANKTGAALTTSTNIDFFLDYVADPA